jgi:hypothetical protein
MSLKTFFLCMLIFILGISIGSASVYLYFRTIIPKGLMNAIQSGQMMNRGNLPLSSSANNSVQREDVWKKNIVGIITSFSGNTMTIEAGSMNPSTSENKDERTVTVIIDEQTKLAVMIPKDGEVIRKEREDFKNISPSRRESVAPVPFTVQEVKRDAFVIGRRVVVQSGEEITSSTTSVMAKSVSLLPEGS